MGKFDPALGLEWFRRNRGNPERMLDGAQYYITRTSHPVGKIIRLFRYLGVDDLMVCPWSGGSRMFREGQGVLVTDGSLAFPFSQVVSASSFQSYGLVCPRCSKSIRRNNMGAPDGGSYRCVWCLNGLGYVQHEGRWVRPEEIPLARAAEQDRDVIRRYSTDVLDVLDGFVQSPSEKLPKEPMWLGVELEVTVNTRHSDAPRALVAKRVAETRASLAKFAILKSDSSIGEYGFEIVTVPATLAAHRERWLPFFDGPAKRLQSWSPGTCGMHVHISRDAMSVLGMGRLFAFINAPINRGFVAKVAGRAGNTYSEYQERRISCVRDLYYLRNHHAAICVSAKNDEKTIELRIFRGNVNQLGFFKNLEFAHAIASYCNQSSNLTLTEVPFLGWMDQAPQRATYPHFVSWAVRELLMLDRTSLPRAIKAIAFEAA